MQAIQRTRPWFLAARGGTPTVSIDGSPATDLSALHMISVVDVREVRLIRASAGAGRAVALPNGDIVVGDVILVITRVRD